MMFQKARNLLDYRHEKTDFMPFEKFQAMLKGVNA
jgi:hypothetical protein